MRKPCKDHVRDTGKQGSLGHKGTDGSMPYERLSKYGKLPGISAETITYGDKSALETFLAIVIDDGVPSRGHREIVFNSKFTKFACFKGPHKKFKSMAVCLYSEGFETKFTKPQGLLLEELERWLAEPIIFWREPEDYISYKESKSTENNQGIVTKTVTRVYLLDDGESETQI